jgi:hypothetical protein
VIAGVGCAGAANGRAPNHNDAGENAVGNINQTARYGANGQRDEVVYLI